VEPSPGSSAGASLKSYGRPRARAGWPAPLAPPLEHRLWHITLWHRPAATGPETTMHAAVSALGVLGAGLQRRDGTARCVCVCVCVSKRQDLIATRSWKAVTGAAGRMPLYAACLWTPSHQQGCSRSSWGDSSRSPSSCLGGPSRGGWAAARPMGRHAAAGRGHMLMQMATQPLAASRLRRQLGRRCTQGIKHARGA
jgi:hypothetical protein